MKVVGYVDFNGQRGLGDPGRAGFSGDSDGDKFSDELTVPGLAVFLIALVDRADRAQAPLELAGHVICRPGATDRDQTILAQVLERLPGNRFRQEDRDGAAILSYSNAPGSCAFGHEVRVACAHHDRDPGLKETDHHWRNHGS